MGEVEPPGREAGADQGVPSDRDASGTTDGSQAWDGPPSDTVVSVLTDFPSTPIFDGTDVPPNAPTLFTGAPRGGSGQPCFVEPRMGTLIPRNWLRPLFAFRPPSGGDNLFELTLAAPGFAHPLRIYTRRASYVLERKLWDGLRAAVNDQVIDVQVRGLATAVDGTVAVGPSLAASASFTIAPVEAPGTIVYWAVTQAQGALKGFAIGEETVHEVLTAPQVEARTTEETCIGCHASTPDGTAVGFSLGQGFYYDSIADLSGGRLGRVPTYVTPTALAAVRKLLGVPAYSPAHWSDGDRITVLADDTGHLHYVQLDGERQGILERRGDVREAAEPAFKHDGTALVYVSNSSFTIGRAAVGPTDLIEVPYNNGAGGMTRALRMAADPDVSEFYPAYSPDDRFIAFSRVPGEDNLYSNPVAEIAVVDADGSALLRLAANDAPACMTDLKSPGLTNDWPKWSPEVSVLNDGRRIYWLTFSSARSGKAQIYLTGLVVEPGKAPRSTPAVWFWNQGQDSGNHTPAWDVFHIPTPG